MVFTSSDKILSKNTKKSLSKIEKDEKANKDSLYELMLEEDVDFLDGKNCQVSLFLMTISPSIMIFFGDNFFDFSIIVTAFVSVSKYILSLFIPNLLALIDI